MSRYKYTKLKLESRFSAADVVDQALVRFKCQLIQQDFKGNAHTFFEKFLTGGTFAEYEKMDDASKRHIRRYFAHQILEFVKEHPYTLRGIKVSKRGMLISLWITQK